jgi:hypothetical protein
MDQNLSLQNADLLLSVYSDLEFQAPEAVFSKMLDSLNCKFIQHPSFMGQSQNFEQPTIKMLTHGAKKIMFLKNVHRQQINQG